MQYMFIIIIIIIIIIKRPTILRLVVSRRLMPSVGILVHSIIGLFWSMICKNLDIFTH